MEWPRESKHQINNQSDECIMLPEKILSSTSDEFYEICIKMGQHEIVCGKNKKRSPKCT